MNAKIDPYYSPDLNLRKTWKDLAEKSLKGQNLERVLNTSTFEGVDLKGLYDSNQTLLEHYSFPSSFKASTIYDSVLADVDAIAEDQREGMDSSVLVVKGKAWKKDFAKDFGKNIKLSFLVQKTDEEYLEDFKGLEAYVDTNKLDFEKFNEEVSRVAGKGLGFAINMSQIHNSGASIVQEISFGLNVFSSLLQQGVDESKIQFFTATDSLFFMNIAKLRALRYLAEEALVAHGKEPKPYILAVSSLREQTLYDPWVNMLRNCASSMSATLGGADQVVVRPHDAAFSALTAEPSDPKARRSARHILNIIREESKLDFVQDSSKGSFAVEELTISLAAQAWENFLNWEEKGVFLNVKDFAASVSAISKARYQKIQKRKTVVTGVNDMANPEETLEDLYQKPWRPVDLTTGLFPLRRTALEFEDIRRALEKSEKNIKVGLVYKGKLSALSARINFVKNVFEVLGSEIVEVEAGDSLDEVYKELGDKGCNVLALVGKDDEYQKWARPGDKSLFSSQFVAGNFENFELEGKDRFKDLFMGKNIYQELKLMLEREGVEL